jgi:hypothetical protein
MDTRRGRTTARAGGRAASGKARRIATVAALIAVSGLALTATLALSAPEPSDAVSVPTLRTVVVKEGDTIWDLARAYVPAGQDPVAYMAEVAAMNGVEATALQPGMVLRLVTDGQPMDDRQATGGRLSGTARVDP